MTAFLTGSQVYGTPTPESDIDLVVFVSPVDLALIIQAYRQAAGEPATANYDGAVTASLKFGKLNLLLETRADRVAIWQLGTSELKAKSPVVRDVAVETFKGLRKRFIADLKPATSVLSSAADATNGVIAQ